MTDQGRLLITGHAQHRNRRAEQIGVGNAEISGAIEHLWQQAGGNLEQLEQLFIPLLGVDIEQQGARGVAGISLVRLATGQAPQQKGIHGAKAQLATFGALKGAGHFMQNPAQLGGREIRINQQPGLGRYRGFMPGVFQLGAVVSGTAVLPNNRRMDRCASLRIPHQGGFTLIGDADSRHITGTQTALLERLTADLESTQPQLFAVMFNPAILREVLLELLLRTGHGQPLGTEDNCPAAGGALVDGKQVMRHADFLIFIGCRAAASRDQLVQRLPASAGPAQ